MPTPSIARPTSPSAVLDHIGPGADLIVQSDNGEPASLVDAIEDAADSLQGVRFHQALTLTDRPHHSGKFGTHLRHLSYFLTPKMREHFERGAVDLVPNDLSNVPALLRMSTRDPLLLVSASPPDAHGFVSLGTDALYGAALLGDVRVFVEVNHRMPRTFGRNQLHLSQVAGWVEVDRPLVPVPELPVTDVDRTIAGFVAERIPNGATVQIGIGSVPNMVAGLLADHRDLGIHSEMLGDGLQHLMLAGVATGALKRYQRFQAVTTVAYGMQELYDFVADNRQIVFNPCDETNALGSIAQHPSFCAVNATMQVDLLGQCASESLGSHYVSSSGGQADFMRGAIHSDGGQSFIVTHATAIDGTISRIQPTLSPGAVVTTHKNVVDKVVTEHGVAELRGRTIRHRAEALIAIAAPQFRDGLRQSARTLGYL